MTATLQAGIREDLRGSRLRKIRNQGGVPAVVYGKAIESSPITVEEVALIKTLRENGRNGVIKLDVSGKQTEVMVTDIQVDPIKNFIVHVDFYAVDMKKELDANVPVQLIGEPVGVQNGGVLQQSLYEISVRALPNELPESIEIDVSGLEINDSMQVKDLMVGANYQINNDPEESVLSILTPTEEPDEPEAAGAGEEGEDGDVEVIGESEADSTEEEKKEE
ncbi:MAG: 50S ribosomal protein L25/general stress protein Ctc [Bacillus sp. (in: Bacteria)]|nr:50S ribosomal protein L25/general stress protein Ctc [Bacillus sp. (in: firmicutes)]